MATGMSGAGSQSLNTLTGKVKTLVNNDLRVICRAEGLQTSGVKSALQARVIARKFDLLPLALEFGWEANWHASLLRCDTPLTLFTRPYPNGYRQRQRWFDPTTVSCLPQRRRPSNILHFRFVVPIPQPAFASSNPESNASRVIWQQQTAAAYPRPTK